MSSQIEKCYIQRLIYDCIFRRIIGYQDLGHSHELETVSRIYDDYFPENNLTVDVAFYENKPYYVIIKYNNEEKVSFTKGNAAFGHRLAKNKTYIKNQTFAKEEPWLEVTS